MNSLETNLPSQRSPRVELVVLAVACLLPTLVTLTYFEWASGTASTTQQIIYTVAKLVQFALPVAWVAWVDRGSLGWPPRSWRGVPAGIVLGLAIGGAMWLLYTILGSTPLMTDAVGPIREKIKDLDLNTIPRYLVLGVFYSLFHSLLEEYYGRWFVFGRLQKRVALVTAIAISSLAFALHHVIVLWHYFSHAPLVAILFTVGVAIGGALWATLYRRSGSLIGPWLSHLLVDAAIFSIGIQMAWPILAAR